MRRVSTMSRKKPRIISASSSADRPAPNENSGCSMRSPSGVSSWTSSGPPSCWPGPKTSARSGPKPALSSLGLTYDSSLLTGCRGVSADRSTVDAGEAQLVTGTTPVWLPKVPGRRGRVRIRLRAASGGPHQRDQLRGHLVERFERAFGAADGYGALERGDDHPGQARC